VNDDVKSHELPEGLVLEAEHLGVVGTVVKSGVSFGDVVLILVAIVEDDGSDAGNAGAHIKGIFKGGLPVLALVDAVSIGLGKLAGRLASKDTHRELSHGVHVLGEALNESLDLGGKLTALEELGLELLELRLAGELSSEKKPEGSLRKGLRATWGLVALLTDLEKILSSVGDTIDMVKLGGLVKEAGHASHTTDHLAHSDFSELGITVLLLEHIESLLLLVDGVLDLLLKGGREESLVSLQKHPTTIRP
jgi:hypothetical protein